MIKAFYYEKLENDVCICKLCPRECRIGNQKEGYCGTRKNFDGDLYAITYEKSLELTQEIIETEAVYQRDPGMPILSIGNIGCNMSCDFCQNWTTSQMKHINKKDIVKITKEDIIKEALRRDIRILSWTYNDPVVWHEFLYDTAKEAKKYGLRNLYKSAFYINKEPVDDLLKVIDIFSISLKSMDPDFYVNHCKTRLEPVLERIKQVYDAKAYLELSNLVVTGRNDTLKHVKNLVEWVLKELDENVPVHFVAFHPAYKYKDTNRTSTSILKKAKELAINMGLKHVNIGNVFDSDLTSTYCNNCNDIILKRHGLATEFINLKIKDDKYHCESCDTEQKILKDVGEIKINSTDYAPNLTNLKKITHKWDSDNVTIHLRGNNLNAELKNVYYQHVMKDGTTSNFVNIPFFPNNNLRFLIERKSIEDTEVQIYFDNDLELEIMELLDRAYYPTIS